MLIQYVVTAILVLQACLVAPEISGLRPKITDGENANPGEFPFLVSIQWGFPPFIKLSHICGGSILNENYILTAGHCFMKLGKFKILAGKHKLTETELTEQGIDVEKIFVHEKYKGGVAPYDIAVIKLKQPLIFNWRVSAIRLPRQNAVRVGNTVLSGWGSLSKSSIPKFPEILQKASIPLLDNETCRKKFLGGLISGKPEVYDTQICTDSAGEISACSGDSGGPLIQYELFRPVQIGIVSWGIYPCGIARFPSVYTRVASYVDWINSKINA